MSKLKMSFWTIVLFALLALGLYVLYELGRLILHWLAILQPSTASILVSALTVTAGIIGMLIQKQLDKKREIELRLREEKVKTYRLIMDVWFEMFQSGQQNKAFETTAEFMSKMNELTKSMILWGDDKVLKQYTDFRLLFVRASEEGATVEPHELMDGIGGLLLQFRKDLGHKNKNISSREILGTYINDIDDFLDNNNNAS